MAKAQDPGERTPAPPAQGAPIAGPAGPVQPPASGPPPSGPPPTAGGHTFGGPPPSGPPPSGPPPGGPPVGPGVASYPPGPPPRRPGLWQQATSTTGGTVAVVVAAAALALLLLGMVGLGGLFVARAVASDHLGDRGDRGPVMQGGWRGDRDAPVPPGLQGRRDGQPRQRGGVDPGPGADGLAPLLRSALALGAVQHGEFTVTGTDGKATVMTVQRGTVTAVGSSSVAVRSSDGYSATYARDDATRGGANVAKGDSVLVIARKEGATALVVRELRAR